MQCWPCSRAVSTARVQPIDDDIPPGLRYRARISTHHLDDIYELKEVLGKGLEGEVLLVKHKLNGYSFALKSVLKQDFKLLYFDLDHPLFCRVCEIFVTDTHMHLILENCKGGSLADKVFPIGEPVKVIPESNAKKLIYLLLRALNYLHVTLKTVHRDCKSDNIMFVEDCEEGMRLIDLGFAISRGMRKLNNNGNVSMEEIEKTGDIGTGTLYYLAPETLQMRYSSKTDMWAVGVITFSILNGYLPFGEIQNVTGTFDILKRIRGGDFKVQQQLSVECIKFLRKLICIYPASRFSAKEALLHDWVKEIHESAKSKDFPLKFWSLMKDFSRLDPLGRAARKLLVYISPSFTGMQLFIEIFLSMDSELTGVIPIQNFSRIIRSTVGAEDSEIEFVFKACAAEQLTFNEFLAAVAWNDIASEYPMLIEAAFDKMSSYSPFIDVISLKSLLGSELIENVHISSLEQLPVSYEQFLLKYFSYPHA
jgi:serine/threonine protein kinase